MTSCGSLDAYDTGTSCAVGPAGRPRANHLGSRTQTGPQGILPCGSCGAICFRPRFATLAMQQVRERRKPRDGFPDNATRAFQRLDDPIAAHKGRLRRESAEPPQDPIAPRRAKARRGRSPCGPSRRLRRMRRAMPRAQNEKRPPRARRPALPQPGAAVLSAKAGLTAGFGMGPGDPRLCGRARGGRSPAAQMYSSLPGPLSGATLAAAWRARIEDAHRARCFNRGCEELGLLVPLG